MLSVIHQVMRALFVRKLLLDSDQIFNFGYLRWVLLGLDWHNKTIERIDNLVRDESVYGMRASMAHLFRAPEPMARLYVPLRELCRKFDGYPGALIPPSAVAPLVLPPSANQQTLPGWARDADALLRGMHAAGRTTWTHGNEGFLLPHSWEEHMLLLYNVSKPSKSGPEEHVVDSVMQSNPLRDRSPTCRPFCRSNNSSWFNKCRWLQTCAACSECK